MPQGIVMVVDDDEEIREALKDALADAGYHVVAARDGLQALNYLRDGARPFVILLDLWMPVMDGWQFRHAVAEDAALSHIPIIALTAARGQHVDALDTHQVLTKPVQLDRLLNTIATLQP